MVRACGRAVLEILDVAGRRVRTCLDAVRDEGVHEIGFDGRADGGTPLPAGVYDARLRWNGAAEARRLVLLRR